MSFTKFADDIALQMLPFKGSFYVLGGSSESMTAGGEDGAIVLYQSDRSRSTISGTTLELPVSG